MKYSTRFFQAGKSYFAAMDDAISTLVKSLLQKDSLHDCSLEELQTIAREYPYFTPVQFLLAEKLKSTDEYLYEKQIQKLSLYFTNPLWLDYKVNGYKLETIRQPQHDTPGPFTESVEEKHEAIEAQAASQSPHQELAQTPITHEEIIEAPDSRQKMESEADGQIAESVNGLPRESLQTEASVEAENPQPITQNEQVEDMQPLDEKISEPAIANLSSHPHSREAEEDEHFATAGDEPRDGEFGSDQIAEEQPMETQVSLPGLSDLGQQPTETELSFEPYHTVDYFASQGIKFVPEEKPADRFGQQLKSFTEWLKTLKRVPDTEVKTADVASEEKIRELADHSISKDDVVTETMAEVWVKQGNKEKAIETYNKLSLLNPDKSAYFASLVEQLKNS